jgi:hypothetical protein
LVIAHQLASELFTAHERKQELNYNFRFNTKRLVRQSLEISLDVSVSGKVTIILGAGANGAFISQHRSPFALLQVTIKILLSTAHCRDCREQSGLRRDASTVPKSKSSHENIAGCCESVNCS